MHNHAIFAGASPLRGKSASAAEKVNAFSGKSVTAAGCGGTFWECINMQVQGEVVMLHLVVQVVQCPFCMGATLGATQVQPKAVVTY